MKQSQSKAAVGAMAKQSQNLNLKITSEMIEPAIKNMERTKELLNYSQERQWSAKELLETVNFLLAALHNKE
ncbi:hypothetical protein IUK39_03420 [Priestia aryabhattai]|uniref:hypothetical protein n=1 Tax=Priestia aryabhattai TaxID=412384 RepID=UPI001C0CAB72|nr:hypothetical protein [Priestia aryabhattai]MBU3569227.1 hypothetical protein [Priestia aryabhattai]